MLKAVTRSARAVDERVNTINQERASRGQGKISVAYYFDHYSSDDDSDVMVTEEDFYRAKDDLVPSVSVDELRHYEHVRNTFEGAAKTEETTAPPAENGTAKSSGKTDPNGSTARSKAMEALKRSAKNKASAGNSGMNGRGSAVDEDGDDYVIRTDQLALNDDDAPRPASSKGKGKGKSREVVVEGSAGGPVLDGHSNGNAEQGEDLYD
jgi:peroxin-6